MSFATKFCESPLGGKGTAPTRFAELRIFAKQDRLANQSKNWLITAGEGYLGAPNVNRVQPASNTSSSSAKFEAHVTEEGAGKAISAAQSPRAYFFWKSDLDKSRGTKVL
jgi:hypothetical protein